MSFFVTAGVAVCDTAYSFDMLFDYLIPEELADDVIPGCRVLVDFGKGSKKRQGFVFRISENQNLDGKKLKSICKVLDKEPLLSDEMIKLAEWMSERYFCTLFDAAKSMLPSGICLKLVENYRIAPEYIYENPGNISEDEEKIIELLRKNDKFENNEKILKAVGLDENDNIVENMNKKGYLLKNVDTFRKIHDATEKMVSLNPDYVEENSIPQKLTSKQNSIVKFLRETQSASAKEITYFTGITQSVIENLHSKDIVFYEDTEIYRTPESMYTEPTDASEIVLSEMQNDAYMKLKAMCGGKKASASLLFGVTGSGKTKVYMKLIDDIAVEDKGIIVMVPEISLTPQMLNMFYARYGSKVAVLHSGLSLGERLDEWKRIKRGMANIVVGTRSAVFAPVRNLCAVIIDEEQENTYKSEMSPRYHARDVAKFRCAYNNALLLLASATPSVETYAAALSGRYTLLELSERYSKAGLPKVYTVDMSQKENMNGMQTISKTLAGEIQYNLDNNQQTILLINRRGFNTFIACTKCKSVVMCPNCSISLTYHSANDRMMCHYCGYSEPVQTKCPTCGEETVRFSGFGTQKAEQELASLFPEARVLRMDADTTTAKNAHERKFSRFAKGDYDIMIGTQMVAKGLDFPNVTLVGVISVDQQLYNDDFRSTERVFDLLTQVVGRSGRGEKSGRAVIQTLAPENEVISLAATQDYNKFYNTEISIRRGMIYPPYCDICIIGFRGTGEAVVMKASREFLRSFIEKSRNEKYRDEKVVVLGPIPPKVAKISNQYRERIIIKCKNTHKFREMISESLKEFSKIRIYNKITVYADMNPESMY